MTARWDLLFNWSWVCGRLSEYGMCDSVVALVIEGLKSCRTDSSLEEEREIISTSISKPPIS